METVRYPLRQIDQRLGIPLEVFRIEYRECTDFVRSIIDKG